jgi:hypothetical protein
VWVSSVHSAPLLTRAAEMKTNRIHLYVMQHGGAHEAPAQGLHLPKPLPARRVPCGKAFEQHAGIIRVARRARANAQQHAPKVLVAKVQAVTQIPFKRWAVQQREIKVDTREEKFDELFDQIRFWKGVSRRVERDRGSFPLSKSGQAGQRVRDVQQRRTACSTQNSGRRLIIRLPISSASAPLNSDLRSRAVCTRLTPLDLPKKR